MIEWSLIGVRQNEEGKRILPQPGKMFKGNLVCSLKEISGLEAFLA
jgi:hypothetical protein